MGVSVAAAAAAAAATAATAASRKRTASTRLLSVCVSFVWMGQQSFVVFVTEGREAGTREGWEMEGWWQGKVIRQKNKDIEMHWKEGGLHDVRER